MASVRRFIGHTALALGAGAVAAGTATAVRSLSSRWGTDIIEERGYLPGDEFLARADHQTTRAIEIRTAPARIWPWIVQIGYGRGGFYSFDCLENTTGFTLRSATEIDPKLQDLSVGDHIAIAHGTLLEVATLRAEDHLVLRDVEEPHCGRLPFNLTWAFILRQIGAARTRLIVRERYMYHNNKAPFIVEPLSIANFAMSVKMLRSIKRRAESSA